jgi:hypothetical protein
MGEGRIGLAHMNGMGRDSLRGQIRARVSLAQNGVAASPSADEAVVEILEVVPDRSQIEKRRYHACIEESKNGVDSMECPGRERD